MKINQLNNMTNYSRMNSVNNKHNEVAFQKAPKALRNVSDTLKKSAVSASLVLATLGVATSAQAQTNNVNGSTVTEVSGTLNVLSPLHGLGMGRYFEENGFTPEQRKAIADHTEEYSTIYLKEFEKSFLRVYAECDYFENIADFPGNPWALNTGYFMGRAMKGAENLTKFRNDMILIGAIRNDGHYTPNPTLDPINDNKEAIEEILGKGVTYEQYTKDNAETIDKLNNIKPQDLENITSDELQVYTNMRKIFTIANEYVYQKGVEYENEANAGAEKRHTQYINDMNKLDIFRNETNNKENTFVSSTSDGDGIITDFEDFHTDEGFRGAVIKEFLKVKAGTDVTDVKVKANKNGLTYDLGGRVNTGTSKKGLQIKDGKKVFVK